MKKYRVIGIRNIKTNNSVNYLSSLATFRNDYVIILENIQTNGVEEYFYSRALGFKDDIIGYYDNWWVVISDNLWDLLDIIDFKKESLPKLSNCYVRKDYGSVFCNICDNGIVLVVNGGFYYNDKIIFKTQGTVSTIYSVLHNIFSDYCEEFIKGKSLYIVDCSTAYKLIYDKSLVRFFVKRTVLK